ncbi:hypothetical protein EJ04DRAFT_574588 [Polyplosphaeria fusca]|uniref:DUF6536 domain-containing protein n=1 Tax=Polyplosphaeria fusca TaxID=682080 RepID=A0A9P4R0Z0_9PLEO|nr:hypothetical protein EJ04DRAFT_574588 [Polyplosphaeria fusca]
MDLWNSATSKLKHISARNTYQRQRRTASATELRFLSAEPSRLPRHDDDISYSHSPSDSTFKDVASADNLSAKSRRRPSERYTEGWRFGAVNCAISASVVFLINLIVTIWASTQPTDFGVLFSGDCEKARQLNTGLHFLINLLSTILLSSSNYCMQCLSAPTRSEVDQAHAKSVWLDIGIPSVRNLRFISKKRALLWFLLGLSSLPLHLFYNSAVFASLSTFDYRVFSVSESFLNSSECVNCDHIDISEDARRIIHELHQLARVDGGLQNLTNIECINAYAQMIQSTRLHVLLVASDDKYPGRDNNRNYNNSDVYQSDSFDAADAFDSNTAPDTYEWICNDLDMSNTDTCTQRIGDVRNNPEAWTANGYPVQYCLSQPAKQVCKLQFSPPIAILVTILNFVKAIIIFYTAFRVKESPLMTMGDAVASFMDSQDPTTKDMCLLTMGDAKQHKGYFPAGPKTWTQRKNRWKDVISRTRYYTTFAMYLAAVILISALLDFGVKSLPEGRSLSDLARLGFGTIDPRTIINWEVRSTVGNVLVANLAQPILSFLYFSYNGFFTCMLLGLEWSQFAHHRKGLRVSRAPTGSQRSTYFLQLPYRFALPLMALSGVLHWLVSQSIFLVSIDVYNEDGTPYKQQFSYDRASLKSCGYSPIAIISVIILAVFMIVAAIGIGWIPYKSGINLAGSCSAAISAACHSRKDDSISEEAISGQKLMWGVTGYNEEGLGHCTFSETEVQFPVDGGIYAGRSAFKDPRKYD